MSRLREFPSQPRHRNCNLLQLFSFCFHEKPYAQVVLDHLIHSPLLPHASHIVLETRMPMIIKSRFSHQATQESRLEMEYLRKKISRKSENQASHVVILKSARKHLDNGTCGGVRWQKLVANRRFYFVRSHYENIFFAAFD